MEIGTKILIKKTAEGCTGSQGNVGIVTDKIPTNGLFDNRPGYNVELENGSVWRINSDAEVEILSPFGKHLLHDGVIVKRRNGSYAIVIGENTHSTIGSISLTEYSEDLHNIDMDELDITAIYKPVGCGSIGDLLTGQFLKLIAERTEVKEMTLEEICKELGYDVKIVKEE